MRYIFIFITFALYLNASTVNTILFFYTSWCPACKKSVEILNKVDKKYRKTVHIIGIDLDDGVKRKNYLADTPINFQTKKMTLAEAKEYGVYKSIPVILVLNSEHQVVKRYFKTPNETLFLKLIERLQNGFLANGTLPIEKRLDLWKMDRKQ